MNTVIDRTKYLSKDEVKQLRTVTEAKAIVDLKKGREKGVMSWMLTDIALSTGLRVSELSAIQIQHIDFKRGCISVTRLKRKKKAKESMPLGKDLIQHLKEYIKWADR